MIFEKIFNFLTFENSLIFAAPLLAMLYRVVKQFGVWDKLAGRDKALQGLNRLKSAAGYPVNFIYASNQQESRVFEALLKRIKKHSKESKIRDVLDDGFHPYLIATAGDPIEIKGVPSDWSQEAKFFYPDNQPVLVVFKIPKNSDENDSKNDKGDKACTLGELDTWLSQEKDQLDFCIGVILFGFASIVIRLLSLIST